MKSNPDGEIQSLPPLTVPPAGEPHLQSNAALTLPASPTPSSRHPHSPRISTKSSQLRGVKRLASSPNMQDDHPDHSDAAAAALAEKKRNKLGYHRTSVACGKTFPLQTGCRCVRDRSNTVLAHCRRRKIRCLVAPDDPQNRCQNCIRLKKECHFYPVDQQPTNERQRRPTVRGSSQGTSSPAPASAAPTDHPNQYPHPPMLMGYPPPLTSMHGQGMPMGKSTAFAQWKEANGFVAPIETGAYHTPLRSATWDSPYMESPMSGGGHMSESGTPGFWKSPGPNDYQPYSSQPESARSAHFPGNFTPARQESWTQGMPHSQQSTPIHPMSSSQPSIQAQQRSMSLQHENPGGIYGGPSQVSDGPYYDTRGPPSLYASTGSPATSVSLSDGTSAPGQTQPAAMHYGLQGQGWDPSKAGMEFSAPGGWYPDPGQMPHGPEASQTWPHNPSAYRPE